MIIISNIGNRGLIMHREKILKLMRASLKSRKTPKHLKVGLRKKIKQYEKEEKNE